LPKGRSCAQFKESIHLVLDFVEFLLELLQTPLIYLSLVQILNLDDDLLPRGYRSIILNVLEFELIRQHTDQLLAELDVLSEHLHALIGLNDESVYFLDLRLELIILSLFLILLIEQAHAFLSIFSRFLLDFILCSL
jgi:hypothetical protein